jgi:hypothetical protein
MKDQRNHGQDRQSTTLSPHPPAKHATGPVRMRDILGVLDIEAKILLYSNSRGELDPHVQDRVADACCEIFGIDSAATKFQFPRHFHELHDTDAEYWRIDQQYYDHEEQFEVSYLDIEEQVARFRELGLDFTAEDDRPLRCLPYFARAAEAAVKQMPDYKTKLPTQDEASVNAFEDKLAADAEAFLKSKRKR